MLELLEMRGDAAFHRRQTPGLPPVLELLEPGEVAPGDWVDLRGLCKPSDERTCYDAAAIAQAEQEHPGRLWPVVEVSFLTVRIDLGATQALRLRKQLGRVWRASEEKSNLVSNFYPNYFKSETSPQEQNAAASLPSKNSSRDALGRGRGDGRRGAVRCVALTRKRKGGGVWTGQQSQIQWEEGGVKKTRYLRKAISPKVKADWEAGMTVKELIQKYKLE